MKFQGSVLFWMLLNASSASSFSTPSTPVQRSASALTPSQSQSTNLNIRLPFVHRGGSQSSSQLSASVESAVAVSTENLQLLSERGRNAVESLISNDVNGAQSHVYSNWPEPGTQDDDKQRLAEQVSNTQPNIEGSISYESFPHTSLSRFLSWLIWTLRIQEVWLHTCRRLALFCRRVLRV